MTARSLSPARHVASMARPLRLSVREAFNFGVIGVFCTAMYALLYATLRQALAPTAANIAALVPTMGVNFWANRRYTFRAAHGSLARQAGSYLIAYVIGLGASAAMFAILLALAEPRAVWLETLVGVAAGFAATAVRYLLMSSWVFRHRGMTRQQSSTGS